MASIVTLVPDVDILLALAPEELAPILLGVARDAQQNSIVHLQAIVGQLSGSHGQPGYPQNRRVDAELAIDEAWNWLKVNGLLVPESGSNGNNGWHRFTRRASKLKTSDDFAAFRAAAAFPKELLHSSIANAVWLDLARGELDTAVFKAFKAVEIAVRDAGKFAATDVGTDLMRKAFEPENGPLTNKDHPIAERQALAHLAAGAIGSYKNPHSHRTVSITDPRDAQEMVMLASHMLRIIDARRK